MVALTSLNLPICDNVSKPIWCPKIARRIRSSSMVLLGFIDMGLGCGVGFEAVIKQICNDIQDAIPTDFVLYLCLHSEFSSGFNGTHFI